MTSGKYIEKSEKKGWGNGWDWIPRAVCLYISN